MQKFGSFFWTLVSLTVLGLAALATFLFGGQTLKVA